MFAFKSIEIKIKSIEVYFKRFLMTYFVNNTLKHFVLFLANNRLDEYFSSNFMIIIIEILY